MEKVIELINAFSKGHSDRWGMSGKQCRWLLALAEKEKILYRNNYILMGKDVYKISECQDHFSAYGGGIGTKGNGKYYAELCHYIKFIDTNNVQFINHYEIKHLEKSGYNFQILNSNEYNKKG